MSQKPSFVSQPGFVSLVLTPDNQSSCDSDDNELVGLAAFF